jgi:hypothetical protein
MLGKFAAGFAEELAGVWKRTDPRLKAALGMLAGYGAYKGVSEAAADKLITRASKGVQDAGDEAPQRIEDDSKAESILKWVEKFKSEHPLTKSVPVYVSGKVPGSLYVPGTSFKLPLVADVLKEQFGIDEPGVYLQQYSAPVALHELGHAAIDKKVPGLSLLTHGASLMALAPLAWMLLRKPGAKPAFLDKYSPAIAAALQVPMLAEEAAASIMAEKTLHGEGESGKGLLVPAWLSHVAVKAKWPLMAAGAALLRKA